MFLVPIETANQFRSWQATAGARQAVADAVNIIREERKANLEDVKNPQGATIALDAVVALEPLA